MPQPRIVYARRLFGFNVPWNFQPYESAGNNVYAELRGLGMISVAVDHVTGMAGYRSSVCLVEA
jgi:hypothetical protein